MQVAKTAEPFQGILGIYNVEHTWPTLLNSSELTSDEEVTWQINSERM